MRGLKRILPMGRRWREGDDKKALNGAFLWETRNKKTPVRVFNNWLRGPDLNRRPSGYEPDELPGCSTPRHRTAFTSSNFNWLRGPDLNRRPSGYEPDELPSCSTPRPWMRTILRSRFYATFFYPDHGFTMILSENKALEIVFCTKFASGSGCAFH